MPFDLPPRSASLAPFFTPNGVAVIGASRDPTKLGYGVLQNLCDTVRGYPGPIYPVNPKADELFGRECYPDIADVPDPVELAVLIVPAPMVAETLAACGRRGLRAAIIMSGGFREVGPEGAEREDEIVRIAQQYGMRLMGPNGIGVIDTHTRLNTTFVKGTPAQGHIAFLSQSGALCGGIIDWTMGRGIGFSRFLSVGNQADVNETDIIPFLAADGHTRVIAVYLEDVKGGPAFVGALRSAAARKPVVAIKSGRTASGQTATASHTGALAGPHAAFSAACRQAGAIEAGTIQGLFNAALALAYQPLPPGNRIALVTNAGGPAALAADALEGVGLCLAHMDAETQARLRPLLHPDAQVAGPVDMLGAADEHQYGHALQAVLEDPHTDAVLVILVPQSLVNSVAVVQAIGAATATAPHKPVLACLMGEASLVAALLAAHIAQIPAYTFPEDAVAACGALWQRAQWTQRHSGLTDSAIAQASPSLPDAATTRATLSLARSAGRKSLDAFESEQILKAYGIAAPAGGLATTAGAAADLAAQLGFPVALKLISSEILHKTEVGGVLLGLKDRRAVRSGFTALLDKARSALPGAQVRGVQVQQMVQGGQEVIVGAKRDPTFGHLLMFGLGGIYAEALADVSFRLAPLTAEDAWEMLLEVHSARLLEGLRGRPAADRDALVATLLAVSRLVSDHPEIIELDINPLMVLPEGQGAIAVDARMVLE